MQTGKGKRLAMVKLKKEEEGKKPKLGEESSSDLVISDHNIMMETGSIQSRRDE